MDIKQTINEEEKFINDYFDELEEVHGNTCTITTSAARDIILSMLKRIRKSIEE